MQGRSHTDLIFFFFSPITKSLESHFSVTKYPSALIPEKTKTSPRGKLIQPTVNIETQPSQAGWLIWTGCSMIHEIKDFNRTAVKRVKHTKLILISTRCVMWLKQKRRFLYMGVWVWERIQPIYDVKWNKTASRQTGEGKRDMRGLKVKESIWSTWISKKKMVSYISLVYLNTNQSLIHVS